MRHKLKFVIYPAKDGWRWRLVARNGRTMADSGEAYATQQSAVRAARRVRRLVYETYVGIETRR